MPQAAEGVEKHLGIGTRMEPVALGLELSAQFPEIVDFAVVGNHIAPVRRLHRLMTGRT